MKSQPHIVIIGATSGIAVSCAYQWIKSPCRLSLVGRDKKKLEELARQFKSYNNNIIVKYYTTDFLDTRDINSTINACFEDNSVDTALIAHGVIPNQTNDENYLEICKNSLSVNAVSPILFAETLVNQMLLQGYGNIGIISSVAGDRGRKSNYLYGAAKGCLTRYAQGVQHRLVSSKVNITLIKPGPTQTPMTDLIRYRLNTLAPVDQVANDIVKAMGKSKKVIYTPGKWRYIMIILQHMPGLIFNKLDL